MGKLRICIYCHQAGITTTFNTGNALRQHVRKRHPRTSAQKSNERSKLREYRTKVLLARQRWGMNG